jgi:hypothetical protein
MPVNTIRRTALLSVLLTFLCSLYGSCPVHAHFRDFPFTRDWALPYKGEKEIETRTRFLTRQEVFEQEVEFEYGITPHFAIEPGFAIEREPNGHFRYAAADVEALFNWGTYRTGRFLPALNVEYEKANASSGKGELKFIATRYGRNGSTLSINFNVGRVFSAHGEEGEEGEGAGGGGTGKGGKTDGAGKGADEGEKRAGEGAHWESEYSIGYVHRSGPGGRPAARSWE